VSCWKSGKRSLTTTAFSAFPQLLSLARLERINLDISGKDQPGHSDVGCGMWDVGRGTPDNDDERFLVSGFWFLVSDF
jgi:hypothetical protein